MKKGVLIVVCAIVACMICFSSAGCSDKKPAVVADSDSVRTDSVEAMADTLDQIIAEAPMPKAADELFDDWVEVVVHGALARLAVQPGTPYSNPDLAVMGAAGFINGVGRAKKAAAKGKTRSDLRMAGRTFAHGRYTIGAGL